MKRIDGKKSIIDMIGDISAAFGGADVEKDVLEFLETANGNGWIRTK